MPGYLPRRESELSVWCATFAKTVVADPQAFGLTQQQVDAFAAARSAFDAAYQTCADGGTRTPVAISLKNDALTRLQQSARELVRIVRANPQVSSTQRKQLGLTAASGGGAAIGAPVESPQIRVDDVVGMTVTIRIASIAGGVRGGKPPGVYGATLFSAVGEQPPVSVRGWTFEFNTTVPINEVRFPLEISPGTSVWFTACWFNPRMQNGPLSRPIATRLQGGWDGAVVRHQAA